MANEVYANNREISCKSASGKSIAAFPDVCFTPPQTPPMPMGIPIPYPNTGLSSDTTKGTRTIRITRKEVMLKNKSYYKTSYGDEPGCAPKKGILTGKIKGKVYFTSWSMDVKFEGKNVVRHMDLTTHNHGSMPGNTPPWIYLDQMAVDTSQGQVCKDEEQAAKDKCADAKPRPKRKTAKGNLVADGLDCDDACKKAKACVLKPKKDDKGFCCHPETTGHHLIEVHCFSVTGKRGTSLPGFEKYNQHDAPCVCASQSRADGTHGILHAVQGQMEAAHNDGPVLKSWPGAGAKVKAGSLQRHPAEAKWTYKNAREAGTLAHKTAFPHCNAQCVSNQLDDYHKGCGMNDNTPLRSDPGSAKRSSGTLDNAQQATVTQAIMSQKATASGASAF
ncbi:hypothetical protein DNK06_06780 [Pseudomonas daroniae]|uniref:Tox-GHH2 domain-containing protein n=1 Tax=Phytopseudomonas daroniae TaxID=2487519 RepID=A0A4Q9QND2_9GAMM|nr:MULTISPECIES: PAAR-like domain-containing protein [Pseudomonas]TBU81480.1 hypothetical protein DNK06_06780 [Pseudomonas daroniae]TBU84356.1 hypothetical protein DNK31_08395 [Pseudomonas sp. FRB 228]TBU89851.1 hypothetical protein DNJ99_14955 [Pseudomonas daroniae]